MKKAMTTIIVTLFMASMLSMAFIPSVAASGSVVGLWHFDKEFGTALEFDGTDDYVFVYDDLSIGSDLSQITVEAWINPYSIPSTGKSRILGKDNGNNNFILAFRDGKLHFLLYLSSWVIVESSITPSINEWSHVAATYEGTKMKIYVNGQLTGELSKSGILNAGGDNLYMGRDEAPAGQYFEGVLDDVRISDIARISFDLSKPLTADPNTVALWHFDEGTGSTTADNSGNGNTGYLGSPLVTGDSAEPTWVDTTLAIDSSCKDNFGTNYGATWTMNGIYDGALDFDGIDDYVRVPRTSSLEPTEVTVEAWIKSFGYPGAHKYIVGKFYTALGWDSYSIYTSGGGVRFYIGHAEGYVGSPISGAEVWDGGWHHIVGTFDGASVRLYVDGSEVGTGTSTTVSIAYNTLGDLFIGSYGTQYPQYFAFSGSIDEVRVWNTALSAAEVYTSYKSKRKVLSIAGPVIFTSAFKVPKDIASTITIYIWPSDHSVTIDYIDYNPRMAFTPKSTSGHCTPELPQPATLPYSTTITVYSDTCKTMHLWLHLSTGEHLGVNVQFR